MEEASALAARIVEGVRALSTQSHASGMLMGRRAAPRLSVSVGVAVADPDRRELMRPDQLFAAADRALYQAKRKGRDGLIVSSDSQPAPCPSNAFPHPIA
jgi:GGDEF domain-containing protein